MKRLVTVTIETRQAQIIRARRRPGLLWRAACATEVAKPHRHTDIEADGK